MPIKVGDLINVPARVLAIDKDSGVVFLERVKPPKPQGSTADDGSDGTGLHGAVMWGT